MTCSAIVQASSIAMTAPWARYCSGGCAASPNYQNATGSIDTAGYATPDLFSRHPLGTNDFGLDLLARSIHGARESLLTCTGAALVGLLIGSALGIPAAYYRGALDRVIGVFADVLLSIPALLMLFALITIVGTAKTVPQAVLKVAR